MKARRQRIASRKRDRTPADRFDRRKVPAKGGQFWPIAPRLAEAGSDAASDVLATITQARAGFPADLMTDSGHESRDFATSNPPPRLGGEGVADRLAGGLCLTVKPIQNFIGKGATGR